MINKKVCNLSFENFNISIYFSIESIYIMDNQNIFYVNALPRFEEIIIKHNAIVRSVRES